MSGLAAIEVRPGTVARFLVAIGGRSFGGFSESQLGRDSLSSLFGWELAWAELGSRIASIGIVSALYLLGVWWTTCSEAPTGWSGASTSTSSP